MKGELGITKRGEKMKLKASILALMMFAIVAMPVMAQMMDEQAGKGIVWMNFPVMFAIDIIIIIAAIFAIYLGQQMLSKELKSVFMYVFIGMALIALNYLIDLFSMLTNNMDLMGLIFFDLSWVLNATAFVLFVVGFYKMNTLFKKIAKPHLNDK